MVNPAQILLAWAPLLAGLGAIMSTAAAAAPVGCEIAVERTASGIRLLGRAVSSQEISGRFTFLANKEGPSGSSRLAQVDDFSLTPGVMVSLGDIFLGVQEGDIYNVRLDLSWSGGSVFCIESSDGKK